MPWFSFRDALLRRCGLHGSEWMMNGSRARWGSLILVGGLLVAASLGVDASPRKVRPAGNSGSKSARAAHRTQDGHKPATAPSLDIISLEIAPAPITLDGPR